MVSFLNIQNIDIQKLKGFYRRDFATLILSILYIGMMYIQDPTKNQFDFLGTMMMSFHLQVQTNQLLK